MRFRFNGRPQKLHSRFPSWNYYVHPAKNSKTLTRFYSYLNTSTDWENKFQTAWSRQRLTTIYKFLPSSSYNDRNNLPIFESFQRRDLAQETQIPFRFFPPFVRSKAMSFAYGKVFFFHLARSQATRKCYLIKQLANDSRNSQSLNLSIDFFFWSLKTIR